MKLSLDHSTVISLTLVSLFYKNFVNVVKIVVNVVKKVVNMDILLYTWSCCPYGRILMATGCIHSQSNVVYIVIVFFDHVDNVPG